MPGLSQLKQFNSDILSLGDEVTVRASRGESPVKVPIPKEIQDVNDSEDFVLGMPLKEAPEDLSNVEEDLSDLVGLASPSAKKDTNTEAAPAFEAPDLSALLNPVAQSDDSDASMPDLSMFMDEEEEAPVEEEEPEEVSVADLGLDALLAGAGFDAPQEDEEENEDEDEIEDAGEDIPSLEEDLPSFDDDFSLPGDDFALPGEDLPLPGDSEPSTKTASASGADDFSLPDDIVSSGADSASSGDDFALPEEDLPSLDEDLPSLDEELPSLDDDLASAADELSAADEEPSAVEELSLDDNLPSADELPAADEELSLDDNLSSADEALPGLDEELPSLDEDLPSLDEDSASAADELPAADEELSAGEELPSADEELSAGEELPSVDEDFSLPDDALPSMDGMDGDFASGDLDFGAEDTDTAPADENSLPSGEEEAPAGEDTTAADEDVAPADEDSASDDDFSLPDDELPSMDGMDDDFASGDLDSGDALPSMDDADFSTPDGLYEASDVELPDDQESPDSQDSFDGQDSFDNADNQIEESDSQDDFGEVPEEDFDTSEMEGLDFNLPDTDSQLKGEGPDFELGNGDDFGMEGDFEIPGFSDVDTAKEEKSTPAIVKTTKGKSKGRRSKKGKNDVDEADFSNALESEELPPNTLSDEQYKTFLKNFNEYPLNVRLAFEDFIVQDEFTDDAEFEIIEKILNKAPARQVASFLEKMLDISIPVPRDYEHRTAEEYEAYKKSLSYQLRNKIIPGLLVGLVSLFVFWGLFNFSRYCIYNPLRANHFYKQGYALLEQDEYPQAEINFERAIEYRYNKNWFFKYARGYREHKQYQRSEKMYENILICFKHDKEAGLEYADMELEDLANYEKAEEIVKREVLDYHINDADGILKLGDIYLEWGTEKDPQKFELARQQYATLIQLYKSNDLYESRMMRYFIRTDNLRQVIGLQKRFEPKEKSLCGQDWTELSGYLLDKAFGELSPSEEYLRYQIEGLRSLLLRAVKVDKDNPVALYNLGRYYVVSNETSAVEPTFTKTIDTFNKAKSLKKRDIYKYIDSYRLLGEHYIFTSDYLKAQEQLADGITLYTTERDNAGFEGTPQIGKLFEDLANLKYFISGDYDEALNNYKNSIELDNDSPSIRYKIGYIQYKKSNYAEALGSFMKAGDGNVKEQNLMQAMANTLSIRGDYYAAQGYYEQLLQKLDEKVAESGAIYPQTNNKDYDLVNTYLTVSNNYGVTLYKLAKRTGNSNMNAQAIVQFSQSVRAWDALTRNQQTMERLPGSNLAEQNIKYITNRVPEFEPAIYLDIKKTISDKEKF